MKKIIILALAFIHGSYALAQDWSEARTLIDNAMVEKTLPGAVVLVGNKHSDILWHEAFGTTDAANDPATTKTLYDLASLSKIVATTTAIMILEEKGKLSLQNKIADYFPEFLGTDKEQVTIEQVLRHEAGFSSGQKPLPTENFKSYFQRFLNAPLINTPGTKFLYSDLGFILLAQVVQKITQQNFKDFVTTNIFIPLEMNATYYHVPEKFSHLCAPTIVNRKPCLPHDPTAYYFSPLELGHAGLFSTAQDLSHLVGMYLNEGVYKGRRILKVETIKKMITLPVNKIRGLGFDLLSPFAVAPRGEFFPAGVSYGHTGYTGTTLWIDPASGNFIIFLANRVWLGDAQTAKKFTKLRYDVSTAIGKQLYGAP